MTIALQSRVGIHAFFASVFDLRVFASVKSVMDGCGHSAGFRLYRNCLRYESERGAEVLGSPVEELLSSMFISCRALATVALSPSACTLHWCRIGSVKFCLSPLLSFLLCATQLLLGVHRFHRCNDPILMRASISISSVEAACHELTFLGGCWQLPRPP